MDSLLWFLLIVLAAAILVFAVVSSGMKSKPAGRRGRRDHRTSVDREFVARKWATIESMAAGTGSSLRDAVSEADKLLDYVMKGSGFRGETMGERLKNHGGRFSDINSIWNAHKLRNALAHEADFDLVPSQARDAINDFRRGLKDLGVL